MKRMMYRGWEENERYCESRARTNKLWCSDCHKRIRKGDKVVFLLDSGGERMKEVYCSSCGENYTNEVVSDTQHPFDLD